MKGGPVLTTVLTYKLDAVAFAVVALAAVLVVHRWLRKGGHGGMPARGWCGVVAVLLFGVIAADVADARQRRGLRQRLEGVAPTYARELELLGHDGIRFDAAADHPTYLAMVAAQKRWIALNPNVADIYTYRRTPDGRIAFVVDSETDYDKNGRIEGEKEERTDIGEEYPQATPKFVAALDGQSGFDEQPYTDRWGTWVSAYVPLHGTSGRVEAALGVDFDAAAWNNDIALNRLGALGLAGVLAATVVGATAVVTVSRSELAKRTALQKQLVDASRQAGMAEMATGVLHNVGNVLNSVNVSAGVLADKVRGSKVGGLGKAAGLIRAHADDFAGFVATDAKGRVLPDYLCKLSDLLAGEQQDLLGELSRLAKSLDHAKRVVASQQTLAKSVGVIETFEPGDLIDDALRVTVPAVTKAGVVVVRHAAGCPAMTSDRHAVLQILTNLINNAAHAMDGRPERRLTIGFDGVRDADGAAVARVCVTDTGCGMTKETLGRLFAHGFTTKPDGHGFGLHHSANAAHALGGRISAHSDGPGSGSRFTLTLPLVAVEKGQPCQPV